MYIIRHTSISPMKRGICKMLPWGMELTAFMSILANMTKANSPKNSSRSCFFVALPPLVS